MTFVYRLLPVWTAGLLLAASPVFATEPKLDSETCNQLRLEHMKYVQTGVAAEMERGAEWGKANLSADKIRDMELFIQLDEQIKFGCRDAKLTMDAERAAEAAKRLELNPDLDPTLPPPAAGSDAQGSADSDGAADGPDDAAPVAKPIAKVAKKKSAHERNAKTDSDLAEPDTSDSVKAESGKTQSVKTDPGKSQPGKSISAKSEAKKRDAKPSVAPGDAYKAPPVIQELAPPAAASP